MGRSQDRISALPDELRSHILSFLPTVDAVKTAVLSRRWKNVWLSINNLWFDDLHHSYSHFGKTGFVNFVNESLAGVCPSQEIQKFYLKFFCFAPRDIKSVNKWIRSAIGCNVHILELRISQKGSLRESPVKLFHGSSTCESLEKLTLDINFVFNRPLPDRCFPALKVLNLRVEYPDQDLMKELFRRCAVLEDLTITFELRTDKPILTFTVFSHTLKRLFIAVNFDDFQPGQYDHKFVVEAPELEYITIWDDALLSYEVHDMPNLREAHVDVGNVLIKSAYRECKELAGYSFDILWGISNTKSLELSARTMALVSFSFDDNILPQFPNLVHLELSIHICFGWNLLTRFLENSPVLKVLVIEKVSDFEYDRAEEIEDERAEEDEEEEDEDEEVDEEVIVGEYWIPPQRVPSGLLCIKDIKIMNIKGRKQELKVVKYLLANATVLEKMVVRFDSDRYPDSAGKCKQILQFPKGSESCQIEFL